MEYEVGKEYEFDGEISLCNRGFHFCENPLDTLSSYPLIDFNGDMAEFTEVEALGEVMRDRTKACTNKIKVGVKLDLKAFIKASVDFLFERTKVESGDGSQLASSGDGSKLASSGDYEQLASSGDGSKLASSGDYAKLASSGDNAQLASSGDSSQLASSGDNARLASSGYNARLASSGHRAQLASSGDDAQLASSGDYAKLASSGDYAKLASSGHRAQLASSGDGAKLASSGYNSIVAGIGRDSMAKAKKGSWIVLAEWKDGKPVCVKAVQVDGENIKEDTFYRLKNGEFEEVGSL